MVKPETNKANKAMDAMISMLESLSRLVVVGPIAHGDEEIKDGVVELENLIVRIPHVSAHQLKITIECISDIALEAHRLKALIEAERIAWEEECKNLEEERNKAGRDLLGLSQLYQNANVRRMKLEDDLADANAKLLTGRDQVFALVNTFTTVDPGIWPLPKEEDNEDHTGEEEE